MFGESEVQKLDSRFGDENIGRFQVLVDAVPRLPVPPSPGLVQHRQDLHWYLRRLEDALIRALGDLGIEADRNPGRTGVWTAGRKIASIGIHVKQWVTLHGFALNVTTDLDLFDLIVPCGIPQVMMTSVAAELLREGDATLMPSVREKVVEAFCAVFGASLTASSGTI